MGQMVRNWSLDRVVGQVLGKVQSKVPGRAVLALAPL